MKTFFYQKSKPQFEALFGDKNQLNKIAYLVYIFAILNLSLQGPNATCLDLSEKIRAFQLKLQLLQKKLDENIIYMLSNLSAFFEENDIEQETMNITMLSVKEHLNILEEEISRYFPNLPDTPFALARSSFTIRVEDVPENAQEEFIELITSDAAKTDFSAMSVTKFWINSLQSYPVLSEIALRLILPSNQLLSHIFTKRGVLITMIWTTIGLSLIYALLLKYWKNLSYPKFLPTSTLTIFTILVNQHIVQVTTLKQLFWKLLMICSFLLTKATYLN